MHQRLLQGLEEHISAGEEEGKQWWGVGGIRLEKGRDLQWWHASGACTSRAGAEVGEEGVEGGLNGAATGGLGGLGLSMR